MNSSSGPASAAATGTGTGTASFAGANCVVVVGCGMLGASAAKYLAKSGRFEKVLCVGLSECTEAERSAAAAAAAADYSSHQTTHQGHEHRSIFGAHYDEGRITRRSDPNALWGELASRSIDRYRAIERESGIDFFSECGHLAVGNSGGEYIASVARVAREANVAVSELNRHELKRLLPLCNLATHGAAGPERGVFEATGSGWVSARRFVDAQIAIARKAGCLFVDDEVVSVTPHGNCADPGCPSCFTVKCKSGREFARVGHVLVAAGAWVNFRPLLFDEDGRRFLLHLQLVPSQVARIKLPPGEKRFENLPSLIFKDSARFWAYVLPPIQYPDGHIYMKLGGGRYDDEILEAKADGASNAEGLGPLLSTEAEVQQWYASRGNPVLHSKILDMFHQLFPDVVHEIACAASAVQESKAQSSTSAFDAQALRAAAVMDCCVTTHTPTNMLYIGQTRRGLGVATGGNGYAAKSADRIGEIAAMMMIDPVDGGQWHAKWSQAFEPVRLKPKQARL